MEKSPPTRQLLLLIAILLVALAAVAIWQMYLSNRLKKETQADFYRALVERNTAFASGEELRARQRYAEAVPLYEQALEQAGTDGERLKIQLLLARAMIEAGDYGNAVPILKKSVSLGTDPRTARGRASAAEAIADIYTRGDQRTNARIFTEEPFASLYVERDSSLTARNLHEYARTIYPHAVAVLRSSLWYANQLPTAGDDTAPAAVQEYAAKVRESITLADQDIRYMQADGTLSDELRAALLWRAVAVGNLNRFGDMTMGDANELFPSVIDEYAQAGQSSDGSARFLYALFLAQTHGGVQKDSIMAILKPLSGEEYANSPVHIMLESAVTTFSKPHVQLLASIDPDFKKLLMTLGWTAADFSS